MLRSRWWTGWVLVTLVRTFFAAGSSGCVAVLLVFDPGEAAAQIMLSERAAPDQRMIVSVGWQSTWVARVGYGRQLRDSGRSSADVMWTLPLFAGQPWRGGHIDFGFNPLIAPSRGLGAAVSARTGVAWSSDALGGRASWTYGALVAPGWFDDTWHIALEAGYRAALVTWLRHSPVVRDLYDERSGAARRRDGRSSGPFGLSSQRAQLGLRVGWGRRTGGGVVLRGGADMAPQAQGIVTGPPVYPLPFYCDLGGDFRW